MVTVEDPAVDTVVQMVLTNLVAMEVAGLVAMEGTEESLAGMAAVDMVVVWDHTEEENLHLGTLVVMEEEPVVVTTEVVTAWELEEEGTVVDLEICMALRTVSQQVVMVDQVGVTEVDTGAVVGMVEEAIEGAVVGMRWVVLELEAEEVTLLAVEEVTLVLEEEEEVEEGMEVRDDTILMEGRKFHKSFQSSFTCLFLSCIGYQE